MALSRSERNARVRAARAAKADALAAAGLPRSLAYGKAPKTGPSAGRTMRTLGLDQRTTAGREAVAAKLTAAGVPAARVASLVKGRQAKRRTFDDRFAQASGTRDLYTSSDARYLVGRLRAADPNDRVAIRVTFDTVHGPRTQTLGHKQHAGIERTSDRPIGKTHVMIGPNPGAGNAPTVATVLAMLDDVDFDWWAFLDAWWDDGEDWY